MRGLTTLQKKVGHHLFEILCWIPERIWDKFVCLHRLLIFRRKVSKKYLRGKTHLTLCRILRVNLHFTIARSGYSQQINILKWPFSCVFDKFHIRFTLYSKNLSIFSFSQFAKFAVVSLLACTRLFRVNFIGNQ